MTEDTTQEIKSKTIDISNSMDLKDIRTLGANVESIIATFEDMMKSKFAKKVTTSKRNHYHITKNF